MASFPTLSFGGVALYPVTRRIAVPVTVFRSLDDSEQRFKRSAVLNRFTLVFTGLNATNRDTLQTFWNTNKGPYDSTWDITVGGTLYSYCCFEDDVLSWRETGAELWSVTLKIRQVRKN